MSSQISDYLTKHLFIDKNVVSFRSLSRQFNIHVNTAKNELAAFHAASQSVHERPYATYFLKGEVSAGSIMKQNGTHINRNGTELDENNVVEDVEANDGETVLEIRVILVGEQELETVRSQYLRIHSEHIYSLSPSPLHDAGLICGPAELAHIADEKLKLEVSISLGRITGSHVRTGKYVRPVASTSTAQEPLFSRQSLGDQKKSAVETDKEEQPAEPPKPKLTGKLDWSRAKPKAKPTQPTAKEEQKAKAKAKAKEEPGEKEKQSTSFKVDAGDKNTKAATAQDKSAKAVRDEKTNKRPTSLSSEETTGSSKGRKKRKSTLESDSDGEGEETALRKAAVAPVVRKLSANAFKLGGKRNVVLSDDDDESPVVARPRAKGKGRVHTIVPEAESDTEASLRAMMDIDDDEVIKASRRDREELFPEEPPETETEPESLAPVEDIEMADESDDEPVKPKPRKRKEKKVWPVGSNGKKKRRVMKSHMTVDEKGYTVTEDYSDYESVGNDEPEPEPETSKGKKSASKASKSTALTEERKNFKPSESMKSKSTAPTAKPKRTGSSGGSKNAQGNLKNFFGKK